MSRLCKRKRKNVRPQKGNNEKHNLKESAQILWAFYFIFLIVR